MRTRVSGIGGEVVVTEVSTPGGGSHIDVYGPNGGQRAHISMVDDADLRRFAREITEMLDGKIAKRLGVD